MFASDNDFATYANWLLKGASKYQLQIHAWAFMTNHVHLLVTPLQNDSVSRLMQSLGSCYAGYFNYTYGRTGTLFEGRFRSSLVQDDKYFLTCLRYIELNPVRAGMVNDPGVYRWSSYNAHAFGAEPRMWTPHGIYLALGDDDNTRQSTYRSLINEALDFDTIAKIRHCINTGLVLGTDEFKYKMGCQSV